ncbi:hypothetical protein [Streptomyces sp. H27-C3]|uniref:hypothetical protein n=1 Tax=Streptomyces sp. H27-C3 TaxID=3046305 RepID=UPI0024BA7358|nr:hypothetical protein [Streptomyces sp. H27-C3]MDJ0460568.1 hypothetical protein [Streptomyces sp. H27-C3]
MSTETPAAASAWLASADPDPTRARLWISQTSIVLLPLGRTFDAIKVPEHPAREAMATGIDGPVIRDPGGRVRYFLIPPGSAAGWSTPGTERLGDTSYLTVPAPAVMYPPGPHWVQPPDGSGTLVDPAALAALLKLRCDCDCHGSRRDPTDTAPRCLDGCATGDRLRQAEREARR